MSQSHSPRGNAQKRACRFNRTHTHTQTSHTYIFATIQESIHGPGLAMNETLHECRSVCAVLSSVVLCCVVLCRAPCIPSCCVRRFRGLLISRTSCDHPRSFLWLCYLVASVFQPPLQGSVVLRLPVAASCWTRLAQTFCVLPWPPAAFRSAFGSVALASDAVPCLSVSLALQGCCPMTSAMDCLVGSKGLQCKTCYRL